MVMLGASLMVVGLATRVVSRHASGQVTVLGLGMAVAGTAFGVVVLLAFALGRAFAASRTGPAGPPGPRPPRRGGQVLGPGGAYPAGGPAGPPRAAGARAPAG